MSSFPKQSISIPCAMLSIFIVLLSSCVSYKKANQNPEISLNVNEPENKNKQKEKIEEPGFSGITGANDTSLTRGKPRESIATEEKNIKTVNPLPPVLTTDEAIKQLQSMHYDHFLPVTINKKPLLILKDITRDNQPEAFSLLVKTDNKKHAEVSYLSDYSRLFSNNREPMNFYLIVYGNQSGKLYKSIAVDLGKRYVYRSFSAIPLNPHDNSSIVVSVGFQTEDGFEKKLLIIKGPRLKLLSTFNLNESLSVKSLITDLDGDGTVDILVLENAMEEGVGNETFLTWYKWNGMKFTEYKTTNIVRNLRFFLHTVGELLKEGKYKKVIEIAVDKNTLKSMRKEGYTDIEAIFKILGFDRYFDSNLSSPENVLSNIKDIRFPEILENPFVSIKEDIWQFKLSYRVTIQNGLSFIAESMVIMNHNPFSQRQFSFSPIR